MILGYLSFPIFVCVYGVTSKQTQHMENFGLCYEPRPRVSEHAFLKKIGQPKDAKLSFDIVFFFITCCSYYLKVRLTSLKPQLPSHNDNLTICVVIGIRMQFQKY